MEIRKMIVDDIPKLALLYNQFWNEDSCVETMIKQFEKLQRSDNYVLLSAVLDGELIGSAMGIVCEDLYGKCEPFMVLENVIVDKNHRRKGVGKALIREIEKYAVDSNCTQIILVTETDRVDACNFYASVGYNPNANKGFKKKLK